MTVETLIIINKYLKRLNEVIIIGIEETDLADHENRLSENVRVIKSGKMVRLDQQSADILNILNDDCLIQIFELLPLPDLCNVADVCQRFQQNAKGVFQLHHTCFKTDEITKPGEYGIPYTDMHLAEQLFRNFGFFITQLTLKGSCLRNTMEEETLLYLATKYCISISFQTLTLVKITLKGPMRWIFPLLDMFHSLPKLELHQCQLDKDFGRFLSICQIPTIQVFRPYEPNEWMEHTFWHLQCLILIDIRQSDAEMKKFIKLNGHLQSLVIYESSLTSKIFKIVAQRMPKLRQFCFAGKYPKDRKSWKNILHLGRCKSLTRLNVNCASVSVKLLIDEFIKETVPIAELGIDFGTVDVEVIEKLVELRSLKRLELRRTTMKKVSFVDLVKKLPNLSALQIDIIGIGVEEIVKILPYAQNLSELLIGSERSHVQIGIAEYKTILEIVKNREKSLKLCIKIESEHRQVFVPVKLLQENSHWLKLDNEIIENLRSVISDSDSDAEDAELLDSDSSSVESIEESDHDSIISVEESEDDVDMESTESMKQ